MKMTLATKHKAYTGQGFNLTSLTDPGGNAVSYTYNERDLVETMTDHLKNTERYDYSPKFDTHIDRPFGQKITGAGLFN